MSLVNCHWSGLYFSYVPGLHMAELHMSYLLDKVADPCHMLESALTCDLKETAKRAVRDLFVL